MIARLIPVILLLGNCAVGYAAEIRLLDGSIVLGQILHLANGEDLIVDTEYMDEVTIEWDAIESITDTRPVVVELFDGTRISGALFFNQEGVRIGSPDALLISPSRVFQIEEYNQSIWDGFELYTDLGMNIVRGNNTITSASFGAGVAYNGPKFETALDATAIINEQIDAEDTRRETLSFNYTWLLQHNWSVAGLFSYESDEQQGLQSRTLAGAALGKRVINNRRFRLQFEGGAVVNSEDFVATSRSESLEGMLGAVVRWRSKHDIDLDATLRVLPNLEQSGRVRGQFDASMSVDLWGDLDFKLTGYSRYDSDPPLGNEKNDFGTTVGLSWSYD